MAWTKVAADLTERKVRMDEIRLKARNMEQQKPLMCRCMLRELSRVTSRYLTEGRKGIELLLTDMETDETCGRRCFEPKIIASVFSGFNLSLLLFIHDRTSEIQA